MPDLLPVHQVGTVKNGHTGEVYKGRGDQKVILPIGTDAGIGIPPGQNRVEIIIGPGKGILLVIQILANIDEVIKKSDGSFHGNFLFLLNTGTGKKDKSDPYNK